MKKITLLLTHLMTGLAGFAAGVYFLPILIAPEGPSEQQLASVMKDDVIFKGKFSRDRQDSDHFHWGEGELVVTDGKIAFQGKLAPGPDYRLYLADTFIETEKAFMAEKADMLHVGYINSFDGFILDGPQHSDLSRFNTAIVWCETFGEFITSARLVSPGS